jgi:uncharacterized protein YxjI
VAAQFCMKCGQPLPAGAAFCQSCGTPVPTVASAGPGPADSAPSAPPPPPPPPSGPPLSDLLGIRGVQNFLLQHQLMGQGHSYRVLDHQKRHLFTAKENFGAEAQATWANFAGGGLLQGLANSAQTRAFAWSIIDAQGNVRGTITVQLRGNTATSTVADSGGGTQFVCTISRGFASMTAAAVGPNGQPLLEAKGHLISHNFSLHDPGGAEVAKVHEAWASMRDTYNLDVGAKVDPLAPLLFAILIDREKEGQQR